MPTHVYYGLYKPHWTRGKAMIKPYREENNRKGRRRIKIALRRYIETNGEFDYNDFLDGSDNPN